MFKRILIANRGEIACRIIRTARRMGIHTIAVYSDADANAQHVLQADEAHYIGGSAPAESYLRGDVILDVAIRSGAEGIHPGYGFLSENADFASAVDAAGIKFIGPRAESMRKMGSKAGAKAIMSAAGVPVVPGYGGENQDAAFLRGEADKVGFPLMIKAAHGGGGKGMRVVRAAAEFDAALESCQREARNAFGRDRVLLERFIESPRHIEVQVFGDDHGNLMHLFERECSAQRRYQKVIEESPSPFLTPAMRDAMGNAAVEAARAIDYVNAGTVEFIVGAGGDFHFMEINTRLQVEHPVTECVTGLDLVEWQLHVASGEPLPKTTADLSQRGHAFEVRIYAEDPAEGFLPSSGTLSTLKMPAADSNVRIDGGVVAGDTVSVFYDPMIAKLIVHDVDRPAALERLKSALAACEIVGVQTNVEFLESLVRHPSVVNATIDTSYLDRHLEDVFPITDPVPVDMLSTAALISAFAPHSTSKADADPHSPWNQTDGWRLAGFAKRSIRIGIASDTFDFVINGSTAKGDISGNHSANFEDFRIDGSHVSLVLNGQRRRIAVLDTSPKIVLHDGTRRYALDRIALGASDESGGHVGSDRVIAPMPGRIVAIKSATGDHVTQGQDVMVIEAMKMELSLKAPRDGIVDGVRVAVGDFVEADQVLLLLAAQDAEK